jgi:hypothetical protein
MQRAALLKEKETLERQSVGFSQQRKFLHKIYVSLGKNFCVFKIPSENLIPLRPGDVVGKLERHNKKVLKLSKTNFKNSC